MDKETYDILYKALNLLALLTVPVFAVVFGYFFKKYADAHKGTFFGQIAGMIAMGIEQKYGKSISNEEKKDIGVKALTDKELRKDLLIEGGVAEMKATTAISEAADTIR
jgi:hypothetical protein